MANLANKHVALLATDGFEQSELASPRASLQEAGATVHVIAPEKSTIKGWKGKDWGDDVAVDRQLAEARPEDYDALVLPGGVFNPDTLRLDDGAIAFIRHFVDRDKPIAAICHGPWTLINAGGVGGKRVTSWPSLRVDLENAGANWEDAEVVVDGRLITSRNPDDLPAFNERLTAVIGAA